jgi:tRNA dimethylallyltransferase
MKTTGYMELIPALRGEIPMSDALDAVKRNTRAYAKRQLTWFRHQLPPGARSLDASRPRAELAAEVAGLWRGERVNG